MRRGTRVEEVSSLVEHVALMSVCEIALGLGRSVVLAFSSAHDHQRSKSTSIEGK